MKVCVIGAGSIGGFIGTKLAVSAQADVSAIARGATLQALRDKGWRLNVGGSVLQAPVRATSDAAELGVQDLVIIAVKGPALSAVTASIAPLLGPDTLVMPAMNGVPWWFCSTVPGFGEAPLSSVDPGGVIAGAIPLKRVLGCVVHASTFTSEPGLVHHKNGQGLIIGEPAGGPSARAQAVVDMLSRAGFDTRLSENIRYDIWYKLWGNLTMNPVSAITGATIDRLLSDPLVRGFCSSCMLEARMIGERVGCPIDQTPEDRHAVTSKLGAFKTSMLQDAEAGRALELDGIVAVVSEMGKRLGLATPNVDALLGLTRLFGRCHGLYPEA